jgi:hypothetical protein
MATVAKQCKHPIACSEHHGPVLSASQSSTPIELLADATTLSRLVMPSRLLVRTHRVLGSAPVFPLRAGFLQQRSASSARSSPDIYDVVCVGGGPAGLSLLTGLRANATTAGLRVALIEGQDLQKNRLAKDAPLSSFSNRCSSLTPASVKNLQGTQLKILGKHV